MIGWDLTEWIPHKYLVDMKRNQPIPTAAERVAQALPEFRERMGGGRHLADALTALGVPTTISTISRIEAGKQPASLEEVLALALLAPYGLNNVLELPYRIGDVDIESLPDDAAVKGVPNPTSGAWLKARELADSAVVRRTNLQLADSLDRPEAEIDAASRALFGQPAHIEINERTVRRASRENGARTLGDTTWQAFRAHAVRAVSREVADHLDEVSRAQ